MDEAPLAALRRKPRASIAVACEVVARRPRAGRRQRRTHRRHPDRRARRARPRARRRSAGAGRADSHRDRLGGARRRRRQRRVPPRAPRPVRHHGIGLRARGARSRSGRRSAALDRRGSRAKAPTSCAKRTRGCAQAPAPLHRQRRCACDLPGAADVVVCDGFTGNVVLKVGEGLGGDVRATWLRRDLAASGRRAGRRPGLRTTRSRRFKRRVDDGSARRRAAAGRQRPRARGARPVVAAGDSERHRIWPRRSCAAGFVEATTAGALGALSAVPLSRVGRAAPEELRGAAARVSASRRGPIADPSGTLKASGPRRHERARTPCRAARRRMPVPPIPDDSSPAASARARRAARATSTANR